MTGTGEGIDVNDALTVFRNEKCDNCVEMLANDKVVLLRAPPYSGKSSFATLLEYHAKNDNNNTIYDEVYSVTLLEFIKIGTKDFLEFWLTKFQTPFENFFTEYSKKKILIVIDETQMLYKFPDISFWNILKKHMNPDKRLNNSLHVLLFAAYGESVSGNIQNDNYAGTPITFTNALSLEFLYFEKVELQDFIEKFNRTKYGKTSRISETVRDYIYNLTAGHVGLVRSTLKQIADKFYSHSSTSVVCDDKAITSYLLSGDYYNKILDTRAVPRRSGSNNPLSDIEKKVLMYILHQPSGRMLVSPSQELASATTQLIVSGILNSDEDGNIGFPSPVLRSIQINRLFAGGSSEPITSFESFLVKTLSMMKQSVLKNSKSSSSNDKLYERQFQVEFYRCAMGALAGGHGYCSPDVGRIFGAQGFLDFYVDTSLKWGVELVRDGDQLAEHAKRFVADGKYSNIPMNDYAILNFKFRKNHREAKRLPRAKYRKEWLVLYDRDSDILTVRIFNREDIVTIKMLGDVIH